MLQANSIKDSEKASLESNKTEASSKPSLNLLDLSLTEISKRSHSAKESRALLEAQASKQSETPPAKITKAPGSRPGADELRNYPELALSKQAMEALSDSSTPDPKQRWDKSNKLFHQAELSLEKYIEAQGGVAKMYASAKPFLTEIQNAVEQLKQGKRHLNGPDSKEKAEQEKQLQNIVKDFNSTETLSAIRGERGVQLQESLKNILTADEKDSLEDLNFVLNKVQLISSLRIQHAMMANQYGNANNEDNAKILSEEILKGIAASDPDTFRTSPEIHGLILQNQLGQAMDLSAGKAIALAFTDEAERTIAATQSPAAALLSDEERQNGAKQSMRLLLAALATNAQTTLEAWERWPSANQYRYFIDKARQIFSEQKKRENLAELV